MTQQTYPTWYSEQVDTTDATVTTIATVTIPTTTTMRIWGNVIARRTGGVAGTAEDGAAYEFYATYKNVAGTATLIGAATKNAHEDQAAWDVTFNVSSGDVQIQVTGAVDNNITWYIEYRMRGIS